jgi:hypothetical protein
MREYLTDSTATEGRLHTASTQDMRNDEVPFPPHQDSLPRHQSWGSAREHASALNRATGAEPWRAGKSVLQLQRQYGNRYVQRVLALARQGEGDPEVTPEVESTIERARGGGRELDHGVRREMEFAFGSNFGGVRIHTGSESHNLNKSVNAVAFTTGQDIFFSHGAYSPGNTKGKELLAHELTHVVQQGGAAPISGRAQRFQIQRVCAACEEEKKEHIQSKLTVGQPDDQYEREANKVAKMVAGALGAGDSAGTRGFADDDGIVTANGDGGTPDIGDGGLPVGGAPDGGTPMAGDAGAPVANNCSVRSGPTYSPTGTIPVTTSGGRKRAPFSFSAAFDTDAATGKTPSCCEVHQFIKWDNAFATFAGGPPHSGFPSGTAANTWIEDRDQAGKRYGHRSGPFSDPGPGFDEYKPNQLTGDTYTGSDNPQGPSALTGQWQFRLDVVDTCNADAVKASSSVITINW